VSLRRPRRFTIRKQTGDRLIDLATPGREIILNVAMVIPVSVSELHETDAGLNQAACNQALPAKVARLTGIGSVKRRSSADSPAVSITSGSLSCMRKASSNDSMTPSTSG